MSVAKDKERNTWYVVIKTTDPMTGKVHWKKKRGFKYKREAIEYEAKLLLGLAPRNAAHITFEEISERWFEFENTSEIMRRKKREHFKFRFADFYQRPINSITKAQLVQWKIALVEMKYATSTKNSTITYVKGVFHFANAIYGTEDVSKVLTYIREPIKQEHHHVWTPEQFNLFLSCIKPKHTVYKLYFEMLFYTGMRRGECLALLKSDISQDGYVNITKSICHFCDGPKAPKTQSSVRRIKLDEKTFNDIKPLFDIEGPYLFGGCRSLPVSNVDRVFSYATKAAKLPHIRIHDLRHSHATYLINSGVNIVAVSKRLGHSSVSETLDTYTHLLEKTSDELLDCLNIVHKTDH